MSVLLYCIFLDSGEMPPALEGVDRLPVHFIARGSLRAATSAVGTAQLTPSLERVKAYEAVVEALFRDRAVIPMRYGSVMPTSEEVARFLEERAGQFTPLLRELDGCVELSLRVFASQDARGKAEVADRPRRQAHTAAGPGHAYLAGRGEHYQMQVEAPAAGDLAHRCRRALEGLYVKFKAEEPAPLKLKLGVSDGHLRLSASEGEGKGLLAANAADRGLLTLYFLVRRERLAAFREAFDRLRLTGAKLQLSGPWPPYNFVTAATG